MIPAEFELPNVPKICVPNGWAVAVFRVAVGVVEALLERVDNDMGPPTSIGESVLRELEGLFVGFRGVRAPGDGEPALIEPTDCEPEWALFI